MKEVRDVMNNFEQVELAQLEHLYLATGVTVSVGEILLPAPEAVAQIGSPLHVITAWNPGIERPTDAMNQEANARLREDLRVLSDNVFPAIGKDPSSDHAENSWAIAGISDETAMALGARYRQVAIFRLDAEHQTVLSCDGTWTRTRKYSES